MQGDIFMLICLFITVYSQFRLTKQKTHEEKGKVKHQKNTRKMPVSFRVPGLKGNAAC